MDFFTFEYRNVSIAYPQTDEYLSRHAAELGTFYELDLLEQLARVVPHGGTWVDVGANIGNHALYFARFCASRVEAIEPHPRNAAVLRAMLDRNGVRNCTVHQTAVGDSKGTVRLGMPEVEDGNPGQFTTVGAVRDFVDVPLVPLDDLLADASDVRVIKIDVEGAELSVLDGAKTLIARHRPHVVVEAHSDEAYSAVLARLPWYKMLDRFCYSPTYHFAPYSAWQFFRYRARRKAKHLSKRFLGR